MLSHVREVAYQLELPSTTTKINDVFHVSHLKACSHSIW